MRPEQYLDLDRAAESKSEFISGEMVATSGASHRHEYIASQLAGILYNALRGKGCHPLSTSNMRVRVRQSDYIYPDALIVCGEPEFTDTDYLDTLLNPKAAFEILSPSTQRRDRIDKSAWYEAIPTIEHYVYISQDKVRVEVYTRQSDGAWLKRVVQSSSGDIQLSAIAVKLPVALLYEGSGTVEEAD